MNPASDAPTTPPHPDIRIIDVSLMHLVQWLHGLCCSWNAADGFWEAMNCS